MFDLLFRSGARLSGRSRFAAALAVGGIVLGGASLTGISGCGGHSAAATSDLTPITVSIDWGARSRSVNAPSSALSCIISLQSGNATNGGNIDFPVINRDTTTPSAYTQVWTSTATVRPGDNKVNIRFYAKPDGETTTNVGSNPVVADITQAVTIKTDGTGIGPFTLTSKVASVAVVPAQTVSFGNTGTIGFQAFNAAGAQIVLTQGASFFSAASGGTASITSGGDITPVFLGPTRVSATVDGITSPFANVYSIVGVGSLTASADGLKSRETTAGSGTGAAAGDTVGVRYALYLSADGNLDSGNYTLVQSNFGGDVSSLFTFTLGGGNTIPGFDEAVSGMKPGSTRIVVIPPALGYGANAVTDNSGNVLIPANSTLIYLIQRP